MRPRSAMFPFQQEGARRAVAVRRLALLLEPGYGKTVTALTALADLGAWPALVVAPAGVVETGVWEEEARRWEHLKNLSVRPLLGTQAQRLKLLHEDSHIEVISYENFRWLTSEVPAERRYAAIVWDELSKMKDPGSARFRRARGRSERIPVRLGLTGTPVGNHLLDLWAELFCVVGEAEHPLAPTYTAYRQGWFEPLDYWKRVWRLKCCPECAGGGAGCQKDPPWLACPCHQRAIAAISKRIAPFAYVPPRGTAVRKPPVFTNPIHVPMPPEHLRISTELTNKLWATLPSGAELEALAASTLAGKLRQLASGAVYRGNPDVLLPEGPGSDWEEVHEAKLDALDELLESLGGQPALVFTWFKHETVRIKRRLSSRYRWGDFATQGADAVKAWNAGRLDVLLVHPQAAGHGLNLQAGGHHIIWFALPWSHELWTQGNGRLARVGQRADRVTAHQLLCGPADERVASALGYKGAVEAEVVHGLR